MGYLNISTSKRCVPKLLRLTWKGYPLHHHKEHKWGYLIPTADSEDVLRAIQIGQIETDFPLKQFLSVVDESFPSQNKSASAKSSDMLDDVYDLAMEDEVEETRTVKKNKKSIKSTKSATSSKYSKKGSKTDEVGIDIGLPGVRFCGLPHKNGPKYRVGNPLAKDFVRLVLFRKNLSYMHVK